MAHEVIVVLVQNGTGWDTGVVPFKVLVDKGPSEIVWRTAGPSNPIFPENDYFFWKTIPPPLEGRLPERRDEGKTLRLVYDNTFSGVWEYGIAIKNDVTGPHVIDPEIDNGPPGPPKPKPSPPPPPNTPNRP